MKKQVLNDLKALRLGLFFVWPWLIGLTAFYILPFALSLYYGFTTYTLLSPPEWVGLDNFKSLIKDDMFRLSLKNTLYFVAIGFPITQLIALIISMMLNSVREKIMKWFRAAYFFPGLLPGVVMAITWYFMMNPSYGVVNFLLTKVGITPPPWFESPLWAKPGIILLFFWSIGGSIIIYLAALNDVPVQLYEAASIDGASMWQKNLKITIPMISPAIFFNVVMGMIGTFQVFTEPWVITRGGPNNSTLTASMFIYKQAFMFLHMGMASAAAWILFLIIFAATIIFLKLSKKLVYYRGG